MESKCIRCGRFLRYTDDSYLSEGGWCELEGYDSCSNKKCIDKLKEATND